MKLASTNEENFKRTRTRQLLKRGLAPNVVKAKLRADRCTITDVDIAGGYNELHSSAREELKALVEKSLRKLDRGGRNDLESKKAFERVVQSLMRKGHRGSDVRTILAAMLKDREP